MPRRWPGPGIAAGAPELLLRAAGAAEEEGRGGEDRLMFLAPLRVFLFLFSSFSPLFFRRFCVFCVFVCLSVSLFFFCFFFFFCVCVCVCPCLK